MPTKTDHYAHGTDRAAVEAVMRFSAVKRWHMIETTGSQTLADHSACVAALTYLVARTAPEMFFGSSAAILPLALFHDLPEVFTGDFPSHSKQWLDRKVLSHMESEIAPKEFRYVGTEDQETLVKICDLADGIRFIRNRGVDMTGEHALRGLEAQLRGKFLGARARWPAVVYCHAVDIIEFYAYETRKHIAGEDPICPPRNVEDDLARGSGNKSRGTRPKLRDDCDQVPVRDRVDRTKIGPGDPHWPGQIRGPAQPDSVD